ncbi:MAG: 4Fe-4S binding protein [Coriobacteriia bacterium]|nr:4Fe-4S binding protein [Coriobacteriia bacterium]
MREIRYIDGVASLRLDRELCTGCRECMEVCPQGVFAVAEDRKVRISDLDGCMECGACALNCSAGAISLKPGVGCAGAIIRSWVFGGPPTCGCDPGESGEAAQARCGEGPRGGGDCC